MQFYYVKNSKMVNHSKYEKTPHEKDRLQSTNLLLGGHYVESGNGLTFLVRKFDSGDICAIDDESYEKLTIGVKNYTIGEPLDVESPNIQIYYSSGSSSFVAKGHGVYSSSGKGNLTIKKVDKNSIDLDLDLKISAEPAGSFPFKGKEIRIQGSFIFRGKKLEELSPWLGIPGDSEGKEVYP